MLTLKGSDNGPRPGTNVNNNNGSSSVDTRRDMEPTEESNSDPKRLSVEFPAELQSSYGAYQSTNGRPRKRSSWFSEMCLGKESKLSGMEMASTTPSLSSSTGPDGKSRGHGGVGSRFRASIYSVLGKLGRSMYTQRGVHKRSIRLYTCTHHLRMCLPKFRYKVYNVCRRSLITILPPLIASNNLLSFHPHPSTLT